MHVSMSCEMANRRSTADLASDHQVMILNKLYILYVSGILTYLLQLSKQIVLYPINELLKEARSTSMIEFDKVNLCTQSMKKVEKTHTESQKTETIRADRMRKEWITIAWQKIHML